MTNPTTSKSRKANTAAVEAEPKVEETVTVETVPNDVVPVDTEVNSEVETDNVEDDKPRIPEILAENPIFKEFCERYLEGLDKIAAYNKKVLAAKDAEWTTLKILEKARALGNPDDAANTVESIKNALDEMEKAATVFANARKAVIEATSKELGIEANVSSERNAEEEAPLKEMRKVAVTIGTNLSTIAQMTNDEKASEAVLTFLSDNPMPAIGRDQTHSFGTDGKATPKYRVTVSVSRDGTELFAADGFTKAAANLTKYYERGSAPKSDTLRAAWEKAGNSADKTVTNPVKFDDNGLNYTITKK